MLKDLSELHSENDESRTTIKEKDDLISELLEKR